MTNEEKERVADLQLQCDMLEESLSTLWELAAQGGSVEISHESGRFPAVKIHGIDLSASDEAIQKHRRELIAIRQVAPMQTVEFCRALRRLRHLLR